MPAMAMLHDTDPKDDLLSKVGSIEDVEVFNSNVLIAIYKRPAQTATKVWLPDQTRDEDKYQGKVGLVLKMGPLAFKDEPERGIVFPNRVTVGDWVVLRVSDGWGCAVNQQDCRMIRDTDIKMKIARPDSVY